MNRPKGYGSINSQLSSSMESPGVSGDSAFSKKLADNITTNLYTINNGSRTLDQALKIIGSSRDNQGLRDKVHVTQTNVNQIISQMSKDLQKFAALSRTGDKPQKLQKEKLINNFKETVQAYSDLQQQLALKMKSNPLPSLITMEDDNNFNSDAVESDQRQLIAQRHLQNELEFEQSLLLERENRMKQIEGDIIDVNEIMRELGAMVHSNASDINSIECAIETIHVNVESGTAELKKAEVYQNKRRRKNCWLLTIAVIAFIVFLIIVIQFLR